MASSPATPLQASAEEKLALLKKVYRTLKQEMERREESHATERATWQRERATLLSRGDQLKRELSTLKASVRTAAAEAEERLRALDFGPPPPASAPAPHAALAPSQRGSRSSGAQSAQSDPQSSAQSGYARSSYTRRGLELANQMLSAKDVLISALGTRLETVTGGMTVPSAVQHQLEVQLQVTQHPPPSLTPSLTPFLTPSLTFALNPP